MYMHGHGAGLHQCMDMVISIVGQNTAPYDHGARIQYNRRKNKQQLSFSKTQLRFNEKEGQQLSSLCSCAK